MAISKTNDPLARRGSIVVVTRIRHSHPERRRPHWWRGLHLWQRALLVAVVLGTLVVSAGLIYYGPRLQPATPARRVTLAATPRPGQATPPGNDVWYYWGQNQPLDQQP
jgi:hypothetical protein